MKNQEKFDKSGDGYVSKENFLRGYAEYFTGGEEEALKAFQLADTAAANSLATHCLATNAAATPPPPPMRSVMASHPGRARRAIRRPPTAMGVRFMASTSERDLEGKMDPSAPQWKARPGHSARPRLTPRRMDARPV